MDHHYSYKGGGDESPERVPSGGRASGAEDSLGLVRSAASAAARRARANGTSITRTPYRHGNGVASSATLVVNPDLWIVCDSASKGARMQIEVDHRPLNSVAGEKLGD